MSIWEAVGLFWIVFGVFFSFVGVLGVLRLPDVYTRLHATGKVASLGVFGLVLGSAFIAPQTALKVIMLAVFIIFSGPVTSHAIGAAVHRRDQRRAGAAVSGNTGEIAAEG